MIQYSSSLIPLRKTWFLFFTCHNFLSSFNIHDSKYAFLYVLLCLTVFLQLTIATLAKNHRFLLPNSMIPRMQSFASCIKFEDEGESVRWSLPCLCSHLDCCLESLSFLQCYWDCEVIAKTRRSCKLFYFPRSQKYLISHLCLYGCHYAQEELALI